MQSVQEQFRGRGGAHAYNTIMLHSAPTIPSKLKFKWAAPELVEGALVEDTPGATRHISLDLDNETQGMHSMRCACEALWTASGLRKTWGAGTTAGKSL